MECKKGFTYEHLTKMITRNFLENNWRTHRAEVLWRREQALMPNDQAEAEQFLKAETKFKEKKPLLMERLGKVREEIKKHEAEFKAIKLYGIGLSHDEHCRRYQQREKVRDKLYGSRGHRNYIREKLQKLKSLSERGEKRSNSSDDNPRPQKRIVSIKCPTEDCRGFLNEDYHCGLCNKDICSSCFCLKTNGHECRAEDKASTELIQKETKPCPRCASRIEKSTGCRQMWCTQCHTTFDWYTGEIELYGRNHNPHYHEWLRQTGQPNLQHGQDNCQIYEGELSELTILLSKESRTTLKTVLSNPRSWDYGKVNYKPPTLVQVEESNKEYRIRYLKGKINEKEFKRYLKIQSKTHSKNTEIYQILSTFGIATWDILKKMYRVLKSSLSSQIDNKYNIPAQLTQLPYGIIRDVLERKDVPSVELGPQGELILPSEWTRSYFIKVGFHHCSEGTVEYTIMSSLTSEQRIKIGESVCTQLLNLRTYIQKCLTNVHKRYNVKAPCILDNWELIL